MNDFIRTKLEKLKADYFHVKEKPFSHFYCPILFRDEDQPLCRAHLINQAFKDSGPRQDFCIPTRHYDWFGTEDEVWKRCNSVA
jgi:hypothetical protein